MSRATLASVLTACMVLLPATAQAVTTVSATESCREGHRDTQECAVAVRLAGDDGPSDVTVERPSTGVVLRDAFGTVAGTGCEPLEGAGGTAVRCPSTAGTVVSLHASAGAGDDRLVLDDHAWVDAGSGDDDVLARNIAGGPGDDVLRDTLRAVYRVDTRDARGRPVALRARQELCSGGAGNEC